MLFLVQVREIYALMNADLDAIGIYLDSWGVKRMVSFIIRRWKSPSTALGQKDIFWYLHIISMHDIYIYIYSICILYI